MADDDIVRRVMAMMSSQNRKQYPMLKVSFFVTVIDLAVLLKIQSNRMNSVQAIAHRIPMFDEVFVPRLRFRFR